MGNLQKKILGHMLECTSELENTNHISKALGLAQPTIFKSIRLLEKEKYVLARQENLRGIRTLKLTEKGVAAALLSGKEKEKIYIYLQRHIPSSSLLLLMNIIKNKNTLGGKWIKFFIDYYILHEEQKKNESGEMKPEELIATLIAGPKNSVIDPRKLEVLNLDQVIALLELLINKICSINMIINHLESKIPEESRPRLEHPIAQVKSEIPTK